MNTRHRSLATVALALAIALASAPVEAQQRTQAGPMIHSGGAVFSVSPDFVTPTDAEYKVAFELAEPASSPDRPNAAINTVARFLNMHAQAGVPPENLSGAIVAHGGSSFGSSRHWPGCGGPVSTPSPPSRRSHRAGGQYVGIGTE